MITLLIHAIGANVNSTKLSLLLCCLTEELQDGAPTQASLGVSSGAGADGPGLALGGYLS